MKKVILIAINIALMLSFQTTIKAEKEKFYQIAFLETIERSPTVAVEKKFDTPNVYKDEVISIEWNPRPNGLDFELINNTNNSMSVIWDQCVFVDQEGKTHKTMHAGVKYIDRNNAMPPSLIPPNGKISDLLYPSDYVYYSTAKYGGGWKSPDIFRERIKGMQTYDPKTKKLDMPFTPQSFKGLLMIETQGKKYLYTFTFKTYKYMKIKKVKPEIPEIFPIAKVTDSTVAPGEKAPIKIKEGMTIAEVEKLLGKPIKQATIGNKTKYIYDDWKITFVDGKVKEVDF